ncbi:MAG: amidohydrolase [Fimbriimonadaceae bacterium]|nr:amidohydrolase [Fimbriimonadaceae bacterium]
MTRYTNFRWGLTDEPMEMLVDDGRVVARETKVRTEVGTPRDLEGARLFPAFIDNHCHILPTGLDLAKLFLGAAVSREEVLDLVYVKHRELPPDEWLHAVHYDQNRFGDGRHLTRDDLDAVSPDRPILLRHQSGHASVANSAALRAAKVTEDEPDPSGGEFGRDANGRLTGVLLEDAHDRVTAAAPRPSRERMVEAILAAGDSMADYGIACASDMMTGFFDLEDELWAYREASERGCRIRLRLYVQWSTVFGPRAMPKERFRELCQAMDPDRCRVAGIKIFADGAISAATAAIYGEFTTGGDGRLIYSTERLRSMVRTANEAGYQIAIHAIGDRAVDEVMDAYRLLDDPRRHRIEHATMLSDGQIERLVDLGCFVTMQPEFLARFGPSYARQLGPDRASRLKRYRSCLDAGVRLSLSSDRPIVGGDPSFGLACAVVRPEGFDPNEGVERDEAIVLYTLEAARANEDANEMGALIPGQFADFRLETA